MTTRRLAAILAADVVGYSRLMGIDEVATLQALKTYGGRASLDHGLDSGGSGGHDVRAGAKDNRAARCPMTEASKQGTKVPPAALCFPRRAHQWHGVRFCCSRSVAPYL